MHRILSLLLLFTFPLHAQEYTLSLTAIFCDEAPYLREWIEYNKLIGVEHFYLFNHHSKDDYMEILAPYIESGEVELFHCFEPQSRIAQRAVYDYALDKLGKQTKWMAFLDCDEFVVPMKDPDFPTFLSQFEEYGGVAINWHIYGSAGLDHLSPDFPMVEQLTFKVPLNYKKNCWIKSIVHPSLTTHSLSSHHFAHLEGYTTVSPTHEPVEWMTNVFMTIDEIRINHYWTRAHDFALTTKIDPFRFRRKTPEEAMELVQDVLVNATIEDRAIFRFLPALKEKLADRTDFLNQP